MRKARVAAVAVVLLGTLAWAQLPERPYAPAFPGDPAKSQAEAGALGYMRTAVMAQRDYFKKHGGYATSLSALAGHGSFTRRMINPDRGAYRVSFRGSESSYALQLTPVEFAPDRRAFFVDQTGIFHVEEGKPATAASPKLKAGE